MPDYDNNIEVAKILISRLERLSVDSYWAHRASGMRGALIRLVDKLEINKDVQNEMVQSLALKTLIQNGYKLLIKAAREIPDCQ
jgi:hypothetical protein